MCLLAFFCCLEGCLDLGPHRNWPADDQTCRISRDIKLTFAFFDTSFSLSGQSSLLRTSMETSVAENFTCLGGFSYLDSWLH